MYYEIMPNNIKPIVLIARFAHKCTIQEVYIVASLSFSRLNNIPAANRQATININCKGINQLVIIAIWYSANVKALKIYANLLDAIFLKVKNANPRKKNSSSSELIKDMYSATKTKLFLFTPILFCNAAVTFDKSKYGPIIKICA